MATFTSVHDSHDHTGVPGVAAAAFVGAKAFHNTTQSIPDNTSTVATFNSEDYDTDAIHNTATNTGRMTVPAGKGGKWRMTAFIFFAADADGYRQVNFQLNGATALAPRVIVPVSSASIGTGILVTDTFNLSAADYVEVMVFVGGANNSLNIGHASARIQQCSFTADFLGA